MAFRADEEAKQGREEVIQKFITRHLSTEQRSQGEQALHVLIDKYGPVVESYPAWHPIVASSPIERDSGFFPETIPGDTCGYKGLDHTIYLRNAMITCPYSGVDEIIEAVRRLEVTPIADVIAEPLDVPLYMPNAKPVLIKCEWSSSRIMDYDGTIPKSIAVPLMIEVMMKHWTEAKVAETWETMRSYMLGSPRGSRSSLFVNQETGQVMKTIYNSLIYTGMYGPIYVG